MFHQQNIWNIYVEFSKFLGQLTANLTFSHSLQPFALCDVVLVIEG